MNNSLPSIISDARVLVVDDEPANLKLLNLTLRSIGLSRIELMADSREVAARCLAGMPDLILLDLNMPHLDGFAVIEQLKTQASGPLPPILMLTAQSGEGFLLRALDAGAADFLTKPFNRRELLARIRNTLLGQVAYRGLADQQSKLESLVMTRTAEVRRSQLEVVQRLGRAAEFRDNETGKHILRMSHISALLARHVGWTPDQCELLLNASPLHDIGKIGIPDAILLKPGRLTSEERRVMETHTTIGADILSGSDSQLLESARTIALCHHERWDGTGYPNGLQGEAIPAAARIVSIADVFDALTSERPYKQAWTEADALSHMAEAQGRQFDPGFFRSFLDLIPEVRQIRARFADPDMTDMTRHDAALAGIDA